MIIYALRNEDFSIQVAEHKNELNHVQRFKKIGREEATVSSLKAWICMFICLLLEQPSRDLYTCLDPYL